jgi:hypothetical protein
MNDPTHDHPARRLHCTIVLRVQEDECAVLTGGLLRTVRYASTFPTPRTERVSPGHLVAMTTASDGVDTVLWRWYLPGADWWVAGPAAAGAEDAEVELDEVEKLYTAHGSWAAVD